MNLMGMGMPEITVILVVAFLVLGPARGITMARTAGKLVADVKRTLGDVASAANLEQLNQTNASGHSTAQKKDSEVVDRFAVPPNKTESV